MPRLIGRKMLSDDINDLLDKIEKQDYDFEKIIKMIEEIKNLIPTKLSDLENDKNFITAEDECITSKAPIENPEFKGKVIIEGKEPVFEDKIPTKLSQLDNDSKFITAKDKSITSKAPLNNPKFTGKVTLNNAALATVNDIPKKLSELENDTKYITAKDHSIEKRALKAKPGYNSSIEDIDPYAFVVEGDNKKAAGITFDRGKYRINFGLDKDNKLKIGGGYEEHKSYEIIDSNNILPTLFSMGLFITKIDDNGNILLIQNEDTYTIKYDEETKSLKLEKIGG